MVRRAAAKHSPFSAANSVAFVDFTIGDEDGDVINVAVELQGPNGQPVQAPAHVHAYLSDDEDGLTIAGTAPDTVAIGTEGVAAALVTGKYLAVTSNADGVFDLDITENGTDTWYLVVVLPDGSLAISDAITFAA